MLSSLQDQIISVVEQAVSSLAAENCPVVTVDYTSDPQYGEFACNVALQLSRTLKRNPLDIAQTLIPLIQSGIDGSPLKMSVLKVEIKKPGFINFFLSQNVFYELLSRVIKEGDQYGKSGFGKGTKVQVEFVSANPTGPLTVAHGRQAAVGDSLVNILSSVGFEAFREYYVNDEGNQINILGQSIQTRAREILGEQIEFPEDGYQGEYIKDIARQMMGDRKITDLSGLGKLAAQEFSQYGVDYLMRVIRKDLEDFGVHFDIWSHQSKIAIDSKIKDLLDYLKNKDFVFEQEGAWWFRSTAFGDDKDRVVQKSDGSYTYLTPDIVYHKDKFERGFKQIIDILGPDHHGYIPRLKAAAGALGHDPDSIHVLIVQLATIYRDGKPIQMSTRRGEFVTLREVIDEVGVDAARFFFLMRQISAHLDFDLELAKKETPENPVFYIQYAHARIHSIIEKAEQEMGLKPKLAGFRYLKEKEEIDLIRKIGHFPEILIVCAKASDPFGLVRYLQELAAIFHKFYDIHRVLDENKDLAAERLALIESARIVLANGLRLLGLSTPRKM